MLFFFVAQNKQKYFQLSKSVLGSQATVTQNILNITEEGQHISNILQYVKFHNKWNVWDTI